MPYQCPNCKHVQSHNSGCDNCRISAEIWANQMQMVRDAQRTTNGLNVGIYGDGGCCGCTEKKRRISFTGLGVGLALAGIVLWISGDADTGYGLIGAGVLFAAAGLLCPNGCCNEYKRDGYQEA